MNKQKVHFSEEAIIVIASFCHNINRAYCQAIGDNSQPKWEDAPEGIRNSAIQGVKFHLENDVSPKESHENWCKFKIKDGWVYGPVKDFEKKTHPCLVPYEDLPIEQKAKDYLFAAVINEFQESIKGSEE